MFHCERCGSGFSSQRAAFINSCPRCLLRSDVSVPLTPGPPPDRKAKELAEKEAREEALGGPHPETTGSADL